ncbi:MAG TPA: TonB-dependent receptor [Dokdonella sp.]|uniref:TonB-dependent receptor n=2 Tax=Dokdonella sp. TaxID=2291710 RepID=UPI002B55F104|nr:TonB-dependent receptor [Dokdonella sp.]HOX72322.1 TonB-dependent receptor [Dokdonella sp.]HPG93955.1 TonB-dependent receptor [Dokdonella sp.]HPN78983.1 TonB-dependent receptor [Dokdonella sp.]
MKFRIRTISLSVHVALAAGLIAVPSSFAFAQQADRGDDVQRLEAIQVTGSRIKKAEIEGQTPVQVITAADIEATGLGSIGDVIQRLSVSGSSLNTKFNSAGNFGFSPDGSGVGSGSTTVSLRNLGAKRTLILVDGLRWVSESSASGVSAAVDLNTIPSSAVDRIEILTDGASSLYGSDAIAGVVNIITKKKQDGGSARLYYGDYSTGDGETTQGNISLGGSNDKFDFFVDLSYYDQKRISSNDWEQSRYPTPGINGTVNPGSWSSATPNGRQVFAPADPNETFGGLCPIDGGASFCNLSGDGNGGFRPWTNAERFNFSPYNLLLTPSKRTGLFAQGTYRISDHLNWNLKGTYTKRESVNQAAPEPIFLGSEAGSGGLADFVGIDASNPYNPFGTISAEGSFITRRPVEGGPRIFRQDVDTSYFTTGLNGDFSAGDRQFFWDVNFVSAENKATQTVNGTYNIAHIQQALGPIADCTAPCVPLDMFGGPGSITQDMLDYIQFVENDRSRQKLTTWTANISGDLFEMPAGALAFAGGYEHRKQSGSYTPDSIVTAGESNGVPSGPTSGEYSVSEFYLELNAPILADLAFAKRLDLSVASRFSDYSNFGNTTNSKIGLRWQLSDDFTLRSTWAEGFRAPSIGELYGTFARFDAQIQDPCNGATGQAGENCATLGVPNPATFEQANSQISVVTGGNAALDPETSKSLTFGAVYSPSWGENTSWSQKVDFEVTYYRIRIKDAIQASDAQTQLNRCVATLDPVFCDGISRSSGGNINGFDNTLFNLGKINTKGIDFGINWLGNETGIGTFGASLSATRVSSYEAIATDSGLSEPRVVGVEVNDSAIPKWRATARLNWTLGDVGVSWSARYISDLTEDCTTVGSFDNCSNAAAGSNHLGATTFHDLRASWKLPTDLNFTIAGGVNNITGKEPPICQSCSLNGYDASTYDLPGRYSYVEANIKF